MISVSALLLTYNEEKNIERTLGAVSWVPEVLVLDSFSSDRTVEVAKSFSNVRVVERKFDTHANQWNAGLDLVETEWVLTLDADYVISPVLAEEMRSAECGARNGDVTGYSIGFRYLIFGKPLRASIYPPRVILFRRQKGRYVDEGHTQQLRIAGEIGQLKNKIDHDDRKPLSRWISSQDRYARLEAEFLLKVESSRNAGEGAAGLSKEKVEDRAKKVESEKAKVENAVSGQKVAMRNAECGMRKCSKQDKIRKMIFIAPIIMPIYLLFARGLILDGWRGWYYTFQRTIAEMMLSLRLIEVRLEKVKS